MDGNLFLAYQEILQSKGSPSNKCLTFTGSMFLHSQLIWDCTVDLKTLIPLKLTSN